MNFYEGLQNSVQKNADFLTRQFARFDLVAEQTTDYCQQLKKRVDEYLKTGKLLSHNGVDKAQIKKEAVSPTKPARKVLRETQTLATSVNSLQLIETVQVKKEKLTDVPQRESVENMPPPTMPPKKTIKVETQRSTRTRTRKQKQEEEKANEAQQERRGDSDVILQDQSVVKIDLSSDDEEPPKAVPEIRSSARTRTKQTAGKIGNGSKERAKRSTSDDSDRSNSSRSKKMKKNETPRKEDAATGNATTSYASEPAPLNATFVVHNPGLGNLGDIMTDDESPVRSEPVVKAKTNKPLFSAFDHSPVKSKVEAFEKLGAAALASATPVRQTRTKTRAQAKEKSQALQSEQQATKAKPADGNQPKPSKWFTPSETNRFIPACLPSTTSKLVKSSVSDNVPATKALSAIKASVAEARERDLRQQEEARQRREALMQAQKEEMRRKREEKQLKALQNREILKKDKQKTLEMAERLKEEKLRQQLAERDMKLQKQKEELESKRQMARIKAVEEKKAENPALPVYVTSKAPLLPTPDCYDSDDERRHKVVFPEWTKEREQRVILNVIYCIGEQLKNSFFCRKPQTIDLKQVFPGIEAKKLKRTSSAMWTKPPRFTLIPQTNNGMLETTHEEQGESDTE